MTPTHIQELLTDCRSTRSRFMFSESVHVLSRLKAWAKNLKKDILVVRLALSDSRTPWYAKWFGLAVVAYALSPIDLIPDFVPVFGYLDDILLLPIGLYFTVRMIPNDVLRDARVKAEEGVSLDKRSSWFAASFIILLWSMCLIWLVFAGTQAYRSYDLH
jgi:uncharacterized membrane protein YkvA (DUF1232 family)